MAQSYLAKASPQGPITAHVIPVAFILLGVIAVWLLSSFRVVLMLALWLPMSVFNPCQR